MLTSNGRQGWVRARSKPGAVLALSASLGAIGAFMPTTAAQQARTEAQERTRLLQLQRDAVTQLQQAARPGAPADQVRRALLDASRSLEALGAGPDSDTAPQQRRHGSLDPSLRSELRRAASELTALASGDTRGVASATGLSSRSSKKRGLNSRGTSRLASRSREATARRSPKILRTAATRRRWGPRRRTSHRPKTARPCR